MQTCSKQSEFTLRSVDEYQSHLIKLESMPEGAHYRGEKQHCKLNDLKDFHIIENWVNDCFHTLFEGVHMLPVVHCIP